MEIDEFVETKTGKKTLKSLESIKKELEENWGYSAEELNHIELLFLQSIHELYALAEQYEEEVSFQANNANKYRKLLLQIADVVEAKSPVVDGTSVMEETMLYTLPQEVRNLKEQVNWCYSLHQSK